MDVVVVFFFFLLGAGAPGIHTLYLLGRLSVYKGQPYMAILSSSVQAVSDASGGHRIATFGPVHVCRQS